MRNKNTIFKTSRKNPQQRWGFRNPYGNFSFYPTEAKANRAKRIWKPSISQLFHAGLIKKGHTLEMAFSKVKRDDGTYKTISMELEGTDKSTLLFSHGNSTISLTAIRDQIATQLGLNPRPSLNLDRTIHGPSGKTVEQLKQDYLKNYHRDKPTPVPTQLTLLEEILEDSPVSVEEPLEAEASATESSFSNYNNNFSSYSNKQFSIINEMPQLSDYDKERLLKSNLTSLLSL